MRILSPLLLALSVLAGPVAAEEVGRIPYSKLAEIYEKSAAIDAKKAVVSATVSSKNKGVKPSDITLVIESKAKGPIPLALTADGAIKDFPRDEALRREDPPVVTNQPKGSMSLTVSVLVPVPEQNTFPFARFADGVTEANRMIKAQAGMLAFVAPEVKSVEIQFPKQTPAATVTIAAKAGGKVITADTNGVAKVPVTAALSAENPSVTVSVKPIRIGLGT